MRLRRDEVCIGGRSWCWQLPIRGTKLLLTVGKCCQTFSAKQSCQGHKFEFCAWCFLALIDMVEVKVHLKITDNMWEKNTINPCSRLFWESIAPLSHDRNCLQMSVKIYVHVDAPALSSKAWKAFSQLWFPGGAPHTIRGTKSLTADPCLPTKVTTVKNCALDFGAFVVYYDCLLAGPWDFFALHVVPVYNSC